MKIGIVTMHDALNAGAILQAYALQTCLEGMGHQIEFIDIERQYKFNWRNYIAKSPQAMWHKWIDSYNLEFIVEIETGTNAYIKARFIIAHINNCRKIPQNMMLT